MIDNDSAALEKSEAKTEGEIDNSFLLISPLYFDLTLSAIYRLTPKKQMFDFLLFCAIFTLENKIKTRQYSEQYLLPGLSFRLRTHCLWRHYD